MSKTLKAVKKLSDFNFESEGAAVALVGPAVGGAANGRKTLIYKAASTESITEEDVQKASMVTVTLSITEYLRKFFDVWYEDAEILARVMGYDTTEESVDWDDYIDKKVAAVSIMKSLVIDKDELDIAKAVSELNPNDYLTILKSQEIFESNYETVSKEVISKKSSVKIEGVTASKGAKTPSVETIEEDSMSEFISKAAMQTAIEEAVQKAVSAVQVELQKSKDQIEQYEKEKAEAISKSRKEAISNVETDKEKAEELFKSLESVNDSAFDVVIKALKAKSELVEKSDLMNEVGSEGKEAVTDEKTDRTLEILKSQIKNK